MEKLQNEELRVFSHLIIIRVTPDVLFGEEQLGWKMVLK